jgi:hypothetical protein
MQVGVASSRIAAYLADSAGVQPGCTVALLLGRGPLLATSLLGVLKAGAAYLVLDCSNKSHMQMMLEDACVQVRKEFFFCIQVLQQKCAQAAEFCARYSTCGIGAMLLHPTRTVCKVSLETSPLLSGGSQ